MALVAAASLYPYLPGLDSGADSSLNSLLAQVEAQLASWCGWYPETVGGSVSWDSATRTIYLDGPAISNSRMLQLPIKPVTAVASIHDDTEWTYGSSAIVAASNYTLVGDEGQIWLNPTAQHAWSTGKRVLKITCTGGYSSATQQMTTAILRQAAHAYQLQKGGAGRTRAQTDKTSSVYDLPPILDSVRALLQDFRCPSVWLS